MNKNLDPRGRYDAVMAADGAISWKPASLNIIMAALSWEVKAATSPNGLRERIMAVGGIEALTSQNLIIAIGPDDITISYKIAWRMTLVSKSREKDLRRRFKARLQRWSPEKITDVDNVIAALWAMKDAAKARSAIEYLDHMLDRFSKERLTPKIVEEALGISSVERRRWIKDGRLPTSGAGHFKKGKTVFQFSLHAPEDIAKIAARPEIIAAWREVDNHPSELTHLTKGS